MPPLRSQVRRDLHNHRDDKLYKWVKDSVALYEMAELEPGECVEDMIVSMLAGLGALAAAYELDHEGLIAAFTKGLAVTKRKHDQWTTEKESRS
jgi:hypothetical protein